MCTTSKQLMGWTQGLVAGRQHDGSNDFMAAVLSKGGAEGWLQVELNKIYNTLPNTSWVQREQHIFNAPKHKVDFVIMCTNGRRTCLELKVENLFKSSEEGRVTMNHTRYQEVATDVARLMSERNPDTRGDDAFVIAVTWSEEATAGMDHWIQQAGLNGQRDAVTVRHENMDWVVTFYVIVITGS